MDFVHADGSDLDGLARALVGAQRPIVLRRVRADSPAVAALRRACAREWITFCRPSRGCPYITLDDSWSEPEQHVNAGRRSDLRRAWRAAEKIGPVTCEIVTPTPDQVPALLDEAYQVEAAGWKGREKTALAVDKRIGEFYRRYAAAAAARGILRVCLLRIGGEAAAMQIVAVTGDRFWLLKIGYSEMHARCSPGVLLMVETIRYAARAGLRSYEFLGAAEAWIRNWTPLEHACVSFRAYPLTAGGLTALANDAASSVGRSALRRSKGR
jgi:CelD/BcsL family acetyltransferase involved in cellulose biosynthesis